MPVSIKPIWRWRLPDYVWSFGFASVAALIDRRSAIEALRQAQNGVWQRQSRQDDGALQARFP